MPIDRATIELVWSDARLPGGAAPTATTTASPSTTTAPWANDGARLRPRPRARAGRAPTRADFVARVRERVAGGGLCVCALDTELLGHWWYEGRDWLAAVLDEAARQGLALVAPRRRAGAARRPRRAGATCRRRAGARRATCGRGAARRSPTSRGAARDAELRVARRRRAAPTRARVRELLALQSSDWAFLATRDLAGPYARERAAGHRARARRRAGGAPASTTRRSAHLAPYADPAMLLVP